MKRFTLPYVWLQQFASAYNAALLREGAEVDDPRVLHPSLLRAQLDPTNPLAARVYRGRALVGRAALNITTFTLRTSPCESTRAPSTMTAPRASTSAQLLASRR